MHLFDFSLCSVLTVVYRFDFKRIDDSTILGVAIGPVTEAAPSFATVAWKNSNNNHNNIDKSSRASLSSLTDSPLNSLLKKSVEELCLLSFPLSH
jgi:hypothetical protein